MRLVQRPDGWWITDLPNDGVERYHKMRPSECGPYDTKAEAEDDRRGLELYHRHKDEPGFITSEDRP